MSTKALQRLADRFYREHEEIDREHSRIIRHGPRRGVSIWDREYLHGYRDALENARMAIQDTLREIEEGATS